MNRFANLLSSFSPILGKNLSSTCLAIDFGSFKTKVILDGKLVYQQATMLMLHQSTQSVLSIGDQALQLQNKTPTPVTVVSPLKNGVIADDLLSKVYLDSMLEEILPKKKVFPNLQGAVSIMTDSSVVERQIQQKVLQELGWGALLVVPQGEAIFKKLQRQLKLESVCILDLGFEKSELSLFAYNSQVAVRSLALGGFNFTQAIKETVRKKYQVSISWQTAEEVKLAIGRLAVKNSKVDQDLKKIAVRGKNLMTNIMQTITISNEDFFTIFEQLMTELLAEINIFFAKIPAQLLTVILEKGIYLTGGASKLIGLSEYLSQELKCDFIKSKTADLDVVTGLALIKPYEKSQII